MNTKMLLMKVIEMFVMKGISITIEKHGEKIIYNLNTEAKSHFYVYINEKDDIIGEGRYNHIVELHNGSAPCEYEEQSLYDNILSEVKCCLKGRDYMNSDWLKLLEQERYIEKKVTQTITYKYE